MTNNAPTINATDHLSSRMRDEITGTYSLSDLDNRDKAQLLFKLMRFYNAMRDIGWDEHTSDWDWYIGITLPDGGRWGDGQHVDPTDTNGEGEAMCDDFSLSTPQFPHEADYAYGDIKLSLSVMYSDDDLSADQVLDFPIHSISSITISER